MRHAFGTGTLLCTIGLIVAGCAGSIMNASVYARVAEYFGIAREFSTLALCVLFIAVFLIATRRPSLLDRRMLAVIALGCAITAAFVLEFALSSENGPLTVVGFCFSSVASVWSSVTMVVGLSSLRSPEARLVSVVCGMALGEVVRVVHPTVPFEVGVIEVVGSYALVIALLYRFGGAKLDQIAQGEKPVSVELSNPESFLQPAHALFLCVGLFGITTGYGLTLNEVAHAPISVDASAAVLVGAALWMMLSSSRDKEDVLFSFAVLVVIAGFIVAPFTFLTDLPSANTLMRVGVRCFDMLAWLVVLAVGSRNPLALLPTFAIVRCMSAFGTDVGAIAGHTTNDLVGASSETAMLIAETVLFAFVAFLWLGFRKFSFSDTIRGVAGLEMRDPESLRENDAMRAVANDGSQEGPSAAGTTLGEAPSEGECAGAGAVAGAGA